MAVDGRNQIVLIVRSYRRRPNALLEFVRQAFTHPAEAVDLAYLAGVFV